MRASDADLAALLRAGAPPSRDPAFELAVMARIARRSFYVALLRNIALTVIGTLLLALLVPELEKVWQVSAAPFVRNWMIAVALLAASIVLPRFFPRPE